MRQVLKTDSPPVDNVLQYLLKTNGKMLRPRLVHLTASLKPHNEETVIDIAVALELIHLASLIHDDVIDNSYIRRGKESINSLWGNSTSVLTGDYLFATAFNLINRHNLPLIMENITETIQIMCSGEIKQLSLLNNFNITEEEYYDKTYRKTACLFASSCKVGALAAEMAIHEISLLEQYGLCLGYAYQIIDDILDFTSDATLVGKTVGSDLVQGNITLPVILALKHDKIGDSLKNILNNNGVNKETLPQIISMIEQTGAINDSLHRARVFLEAGVNAISELPQSFIQKKLKDISLYMLENYYKKIKNNSEMEGAEWQLQLS